MSIMCKRGGNATAMSAVATGAFAVGAVAIGALAIERSPSTGWRSGEVSLGACASPRSK